jgi:hypothetical protein
MSIAINGTLDVRWPTLLDKRSGQQVGSVTVPYNSPQQCRDTLPLAYRAEGVVIYVKTVTGLEWWQFVGGIQNENLIKVDFLGSAAGGGSGENFGNTDLTLSANRVHNLSGYSLRFISTVDSVAQPIDFGINALASTGVITGFDVLVYNPANGQFFRAAQNLLTGGGGTATKFGKAGEDATAAEQRTFNLGSAYSFTLNSSRPSYGVFNVNNTGPQSTGITAISIGDVGGAIYGYVQGGGAAITGYANSSEIAGDFRSGNGYVLWLTQQGYTDTPAIRLVIGGGGAVPIPAMVLTRPIGTVADNMGTSIDFRLPVYWDEDGPNYRDFEAVKLIANQYNREMYYGQGQFIVQVRDGARDDIGEDWSAMMYEVFKITGKGQIDLPRGTTGLVNAANDAGAAGAGVPVNRLYRNGSIVMLRTA